MSKKIYTILSKEKVKKLEIENKNFNFRIQIWGSIEHG
jgi:hypothetical protein